MFQLLLEQFLYESTYSEHDLKRLKIALDDILLFKIYNQFLEKNQIDINLLISNFLYFKQKYSDIEPKKLTSIVQNYTLHQTVIDQNFDVRKSYDFLTLSKKITQVVETKKEKQTVQVKLAGTINVIYKRLRSIKFKGIEEDEAKTIIIKDLTFKTIYDLISNKEYVWVFYELAQTVDLKTVKDSIVYLNSKDYKTSFAYNWFTHNIKALTDSLKSDEVRLKELESKLSLSLDKDTIKQDIIELKDRIIEKRKTIAEKERNGIGGQYSHVIDEEVLYDYILWNFKLDDAIEQVFNLLLETDLSDFISKIPKAKKLDLIGAIQSILNSNNTNPRNSSLLKFNFNLDICKKAIEGIKSDLKTKINLRKINLSNPEHLLQLSNYVVGEFSKHQTGFSDKSELLAALSTLSTEDYSIIDVKEEDKVLILVKTAKVQSVLAKNTNWCIKNDSSFKTYESKGFLYNVFNFKRKQTDPLYLVGFVNSFSNDVQSIFDKNNSSITKDKIEIDLKYVKVTKDDVEAKLVNLQKDNKLVSIINKNKEVLKSYLPFKKLDKKYNLLFEDSVSFKDLDKKDLEKGLIRCNVSLELYNELIYNGIEIREVLGDFDLGIKALNDGLESFLPALTSVGGDFYLYSLTTLNDGLESFLPALTSVGGYFNLRSLTTLNKKLESFLPALTSVGGDFDLYRLQTLNDGLESFLPALTSVGGDFYLRSLTNKSKEELLKPEVMQEILNSFKNKVLKESLSSFKYIKRFNNF